MLVASDGDVRYEAKNVGSDVQKGLYKCVVQRLGGCRERAGVVRRS
jgi:hypothetical protein